MTDTRPAGAPFLIERAARHDRAMLVATIAIVTVLCWSWIVPMARDMYGAMNGPSAWMMADIWTARYLVLLWAMWAVMMAGMMLPSAAPMFLLYAAAMRNGPDPDAGRLRIYAFAVGYVLIWSAFSMGATMLQWLLAHLLLLTPMMEIATPRAGGAVLLVAGIYQWSGLKHACLRACQSPLGFLASHWRAGAAGALRMGVEHGVVCVGCCWALMLLLFVGGVMNLWVIGALTGFVLIEKLVPVGALGTRVTGTLLAIVGLWMLRSG
jgi:predicted metal-binding membrane protein